MPLREWLTMDLLTGFRQLLAIVRIIISIYEKVTIKRSKNDSKI